MSIVRENLMEVKNYSPYCGNWQSWCNNPRMSFNGEQFVCPKCNFITEFPKRFIKKYKQKWNK